MIFLLGEVLKGGLGDVGVGFLDLLGFLVWGFQGNLAGFYLWFRYLTYAS